MRKTILIIPCLLLFLMVGCSMQSADNQNNASGLTKGSPVRLFVATDIHYLSPDLIEAGQMSETMLQNGDGKQINYIDQITDAFLDEVVAQHPDGLILSGDLTFNGEKESHEALAQKLNRIKDAGIPVFVIPGNHDINNYNAGKYTVNSIKSVAHITGENFAKIYRSFGFDSAISRDSNSLSYVSAISEDLRLIMLDTNKYKDNNVNSPSEASGKISDKTYTWLENQLNEAVGRGIIPIVVMHHNLLEHNKMFAAGFTLDNSQKIVDLLQRYHVQVVLSGHIHIKSIGSEQTKNGTIYDIATSALSVYANQYGILECLPGSSIDYHTQPVDMETWANKKGITDNNLLHFKQYSYDFFASNGYRKAMGSLDGSGISNQESEKMANVLAKLNPCYFSGTVDSMGQDILNSEGYQLWNENSRFFLSSYINSILEMPAKNENSVSISLKENEKVQ